MNKKAKYYLIALAVLLVVATFVGYQFVRLWSSYKVLNAEKAALSAQLDTLNKKNETRKKEIDDSKTDSFVERVAREILGWVKPGDIKIVDKDK